MLLKTALKEASKARIGAICRFCMMLFKSLLPKEEFYLHVKIAQLGHAFPRYRGSIPGCALSIPNGNNEIIMSSNTLIQFMLRAISASHPTILSKFSFNFGVLIKIAPQLFASSSKSSCVRVYSGAALRVATNTSSCPFEIISLAVSYKYEVLPIIENFMYEMPFPALQSLSKRQNLSVA